jgi:hypothetical protein
MNVIMLSFIMLSVVIMSVIMQSVIMLSVAMLSVAAPMAIWARRYVSYQPTVKGDNKLEFMTARGKLFKTFYNCNIYCNFLSWAVCQCQILTARVTSIKLFTAVIFYVLCNANILITVRSFQIGLFQ